MSEHFEHIDRKLFQRDIRRDIRNCVLFLFLFFAVNFGVQFGIYWLSSAEAGTENQTVVTQTNGAALGLSLILGIVLGGCVFLFLRKQHFFTDLLLPASEPVKPGLFIALLIGAQGFQFIFNLFISFIDSLLPDGLSLVKSYGAALDGLFTPIGLLYIILIGPIFEELIFRGAVMGTLRRFGDNFAILFSALLFGLYHMLLLQIPFAFVLGLLLGHVAARWSLRLSILLHIAVNGLSVLFSGSETLKIIGVCFMFGAAIATIVLLLVNRKKLHARIRLTAPAHPHTYASGFSTILFWVFAAVMIAIGLLQMNL